MRWILIAVWSLICLLLYAVLQGGVAVLDWLVGPNNHLLDGLPDVLGGVGSFVLGLVWVAGCLVVFVLAKIIGFALRQQQDMRRQTGQMPPGYGQHPGYGQTPPPMPGSGPVISADYRRVDDGQG